MQISQDLAYGIMRCKLFSRGRRNEGHLFYLRDTRRRGDSSEPFDLLLKNRSSTGGTLNEELAPKIPLKISQDRTLHRWPFCCRCEVATLFRWVTCQFHHLWMRSSTFCSNPLCHSRWCNWYFEWRMLFYVSWARRVVKFMRYFIGNSVIYFIWNIHISRQRELRGFSEISCTS